MPEVPWKGTDESAHAYLPGLYRGDEHITRGRRDVFVLSLFCCVDQAGLRTAAKTTMSAMLASGVFCVRRQGLY